VLSRDLKEDGREKLLRALRPRLEKIEDAQWGLCDLTKRDGTLPGGYLLDLAIRARRPAVRD